MLFHLKEKCEFHGKSRKKWTATPPPCQKKKDENVQFRRKDQNVERPKN
jgi:hypothetical protein